MTGTDKPERQHITSANDLTVRGLDVLCLLMRGYSNPQIAGELQLSVRTIKGHIANLKQKFELQTRSDLLSHVREHGLGC